MLLLVSSAEPFNTSAKRAAITLTRYIPGSMSFEDALRSAHSEYLPAAARLALLTPDLFQLAVERIARRHKWANAIQKLEQAGEGRMVESGSGTS